MPDRIDQAPPLIRGGLVCGLAGSKREGGRHRRLQIIDGNIEVHLLMLRSIGP